MQLPPLRCAAAAPPQTCRTVQFMIDQLSRHTLLHHLPDAVVHGVQVLHIEGWIWRGVVELPREQLHPGVVAGKGQAPAAVRQLVYQIVLRHGGRREAAADVNKCGQAALRK